MTERGAEILKALVNEFIDSGEPVSSTELFDRYNFGIKPAMIRHELLLLDDEGFLKQPHHSAGRIPTDLGFSFFAEQAVDEADEDQGVRDLAKMLVSGDWESLLDNFSKTLGLAGVLVDESLKDIHRGGLRHLFQNLDPAENQNELAQVIGDFEELGVNLPKTMDMFGENFCKVFVGQSPFASSGCLSIMAADYDVGDKKVLFFAVGPKRMDYEKTAKVMKGLKVKNKTAKNLSPHLPSNNPKSARGRNSKPKSRKRK